MNATHNMKHTLRSPLTGRYIAKRSTSADLVGEHNREIKKRRLLELLGEAFDAISMALVGAALALLLLAERGVN